MTKLLSMLVQFDLFTAVEREREREREADRQIH